MVNTVHCLWGELSKQRLWVLIKLLFLHKSDSRKYPTSAKQLHGDVRELSSENNRFYKILAAVERCGELADMEGN